MNGNIAFANPALARYAVRTDCGDYTLFELRGRSDLREGDRLSGEFHMVRRASYRTEKHGEVTVYAEVCNCSRTDAARWVYGI
jgi:hypothetical protein